MQRISFILGILLFVVSSSFAQTLTVTNNLKVWFKADVGVTKDGSNLVSTWADQSGNGNNATQSTGSAKPTWVDNVLNQKPILRFDGNDLLGTGALSGLSALPLTVYVVFKGAGTGSSSSIVDLSQSGSLKHQFLLTSTGNGSISAKDTSNQTRTTSAVALYATGEDTIFHIHTLTLPANTNTNAQWRMDKSLKTEVAPTSSYGWTFASELNLGNLMTIDVAEVLVYNATLSDADRNTVEKYLGTRWAIKGYEGAGTLIKISGLAPSRELQASRSRPISNF